VVEELPRVLQARQDRVYEGFGVRPLGWDLFELAEAALDLLTLGQEAAEAVLHEFAVLGGMCSPSA
jgi:hypothetical protein